MTKAEEIKIKVEKNIEEKKLRTLRSIQAIIDNWLNNIVNNTSYSIKYKVSREEFKYLKPILEKDGFYVNYHNTMMGYMIEISVIPIKQTLGSLQ